MRKLDYRKKKKNGYTVPSRHMTLNLGLDVDSMSIQHRVHTG
jgi:hypothetical protein